MRWLWQYGWRMLGPRAAKAAAQAATASSTKNTSTEVVGATCAMAIVCETKRLFDAVCDSLTRRKRIDAHGFATCSGRLAGKLIVVARPTNSPPHFVKIISALEDGHHPPFVLSAAEGQSLSESVAAGDVVVADRVVAATGESLRLDASKPELSHVHLGGVACKSAEQETQWRDAAQTPLAADDWSWFAAQACREVGLPLLAVSVVLEPIPSQKSKDIAALEKQSSLAGQAGALAGMAWKSRQGFRDLWRRQESRWEAGDRLVELAKRLLAETST